MDLVPDSWDFADDVEKDFAIVRALRAAIKAKPRCHNFNHKPSDIYKNYRDKDYRDRSCGSKCSKKYEPDRGLIENNGKASCNQYKQRERN